MVIYLCVLGISILPMFPGFFYYNLELFWHCGILAFQCFYLFYYFTSKYGITKIKGKRLLRLDNYIPRLQLNNKSMVWFRSVYYYR